MKWGWAGDVPRAMLPKGSYERGRGFSLYLFEAVVRLHKGLSADGALD
jgi:hypothetical protein